MRKEKYRRLKNLLFIIAPPVAININNNVDNEVFSLLCLTYCPIWIYNYMGLQKTSSNHYIQVLKKIKHEMKVT